MGKRNRRHRRSIVLRATALPVSFGVIAAFGLMAFTDAHSNAMRGADPLMRKADRLMPLPAAPAKGIRVASLSEDWLLHMVPADSGDPVVLAQADTSGNQPAPVAAAPKDVMTELDRLALDAQLTKGYAHLARKDYKAAKEIFAEAVRTHAERTDLWRQLGYIEANLGNKTEAANDFAKALELDPENEETKTVLERTKKEERLEKGYAALCEKDYKSAQEVFRDAVEKEPGNAELWRQLAYIEEGLGNSDAAIAAFEKTLEITPGDPQLEAEIDRLKYAPQLEEAYQKLASKDYDAALKIFQGAVERQPKRSDLWKQIAYIQTNLGNSLAAADAFDMSSDIDTQKVKEETEVQKAKLDAKIDEAYTALCSKDFSTARAAYMAAVEIDPMRADLWNQLGTVETNLGNVQAASEAFDRARAIKPAD